ncbi:DUF7552 domain-containing protein [Natrinema salifodinae]
MNYYAVCARSWERPGRSRPAIRDRTAAADVARTTERYRAALGRDDPRLPYSDPIVCQLRSATDDSNCDAATGRWTRSKRAWLRTTADESLHQRDFEALRANANDSRTDRNRPKALIGDRQVQLTESTTATDPAARGISHW